MPIGPVITYAYDAAGNRIASSNDGAAISYTVNDLNQYVAFGSTIQTFDAAGNLLSSSNPGGSTSYRYDAEGRLVNQITPTGTWTYEYDALGNRIASVHDGVRTEYLVDPSGLGNVVGEYDGAGNLQAHYVYGMGLTSRVDEAGPAAFYEFDAVGNTTRLTGAGGAVLNTYSYLPFGEALTVSETVANPFEFVGEFGVMREGSGIDYMRNRWYDPRQGRFTQPDPIGLAGGVNLYAYVGNSPVMFIDASGLQVNPLGHTEIGSKVWGAFEKILANDKLISPRAYEPFTPTTPTPSLPGSYSWPNANPLGNGVGDIGGISRAEFEAGQAHLERVLARGPTALRAGLWALLAAEAVALGVVIGQGLETYNTGEIPPCIPLYPESLQACENPGSSVLEEILEVKFIQRLVIKQVNPAIDPNDIVGPSGFGESGKTFFPASCGENHLLRLMT